MTRLRKCFIWFCMLSKRLLHQRSFVALLCIIPIIIPLTNLAMSQENGVFHIILCNEGNDSTAAKVIDTLSKDDGLITYSSFSSAEQAKNAVSNYEADAAWIFYAGFTDNVDNYISGKSTEPFLEIVERETSVPLLISREFLFGAIYSDLSYSIYKNFVYSELVQEAEISQDEVRHYYNSLERSRGIVEFEELNSTKSVDTKSNYLTAPIRGILSLLIMLCTLASAMYFLKDQAEGKFDWLPVKKRLAPAFASCLSAACFATLAVFLAIQFSGISTGFLNELVPTLLYIISVTGFCLLICTLFRSAGKLGAVIPGLIIVTLVLSPIFFNLKILRPIRLMLPTYYYLQSIYNAKYYLYTVIYCIVIYLITLFLNSVLSNRRADKFII